MSCERHEYKAFIIEQSDKHWTASTCKMYDLTGAVIDGPMGSSPFVQHYLALRQQMSVWDSFAACHCKLDFDDLPTGISAMPGDDWTTHLTVDRPHLPSTGACYENVSGLARVDPSICSGAYLHSQCDFSYEWHSAC